MTDAEIIAELKREPAAELRRLQNQEGGGGMKPEKLNNFIAQQELAQCGAVILRTMEMLENEIEEKEP